MRSAVILIVVAVALSNAGRPRRPEYDIISDPDYIRYRSSLAATRDLITGDDDPYFLPYARVIKSANTVRRILNTGLISYDTLDALYRNYLDKSSVIRYSDLGAVTSPIAWKIVYPSGLGNIADTFDLKSISAPLAIGNYWQ